MRINLHSVLRRSRANGPGLRTVVWFQGCTLGCPGCFNPETHPDLPHRLVQVAELVAEIRAEEAVTEGVSVSGGEPFQQPDGLLELLRAVREETTLSMLVFSGYTIDEIRRLPQGDAALSHIDILVAGRYVAARHAGSELLGSRNQTLHFLSPRYRLEDVATVPAREVRIDPDGTIRITGIDPLRLE